MISPVALEAVKRTDTLFEIERVINGCSAAERALRGFALSRRSWLLAGFERGAARAAAMATLIMTAKLDEVDPQAWLADVLARINAHPARALVDLLPWTWNAAQADLSAAA